MNIAAYFEHCTVNVWVGVERLGSEMCPVMHNYTSNKKTFKR